MNLNAHVTVGQAARTVGLSRQLVNRWADRGLIAPVDTNSKGHRLYRLGDILTRERDARASKRSPRNFRLKLATCSA